MKSSALTILVILFLLLNNSISAQRSHINKYSKGKTLTGFNNNTPAKRSCGWEQKRAELEAIDSGFKSKRALIEMQMQDWINKNKQNRIKQTLTIPVVVHILYANSNQNLSDARVAEQITVLNEDFRRLNSDTSNTPSQYASIAADFEIKFCLASKDPNGNTTTGITRTQTSVSNIGNTNKYYQSSQGGQDIWDSDDYLNIWVCDLGGMVLGFTYPPGGPSSTDGVVVDPRYFGKTGATSPYNKGRTSTHEIGHWLNLEHVWGSQGGCNNDDGVSDTPIQSQENYGCPSSKSSCGTDDMFMNYMDYVDDACMNLFTEGQKTRVWAAINTSRSSLANSQGCSGQSSSNITADFTANTTNINIGGSVNFTDQTSGNPSSWSWNFGNGSTSTLQNPSGITYNTAGIYSVSLTTSNGTNSDTKTKTNYIKVNDTGGNGSSSNCDTISNLGANDSIVVYMSDNWGAVSGHNGYGDISKAEKFSAPTSSNNILTSAYFMFAHAVGTGNIKITAWDSGTNSPSSSLTSETVSIPSISYDVNNQSFTETVFSSPVTISSDYYVGFELTYQAGDTVYLFTNTEASNTTNSGWEQWSDGTWHPYDDAGGWKIKLAHVIYPVLCSPAEGIEHFEGGLSSNIFPNPTTGEVFLLTTNTFNEVKVRINNAIGQLVYSKILKTPGGQSPTLLDLKGMTDGIYFIEVFNKDIIETHKLVLRN
jgi:PKD repeat protein